MTTLRSTSVQPRVVLLGCLLLCCAALALVKADTSSLDDYRIVPCFEGEQFDKEAVYECFEELMEKVSRGLDLNDLKFIKRDENCDDKEYRTDDGSCTLHSRPYVGSQKQPFGSLELISTNSSKKGSYSSVNPFLVSATIAQVPPTVNPYATQSQLAITWFMFVLQDLYQLKFEDIGKNPLTVPVPSRVSPVVDEVTLPRVSKSKGQYINQRSAFLDLDNVYGTNSKSRHSSGKVKLNNGRLIPSYVEDKRALSDYAIAAWHTLFLREHNRIAEKIYDSYPLVVSEDDVFSASREAIAAIVSKVHYTEFLPQFIQQPWVQEFAAKQWKKNIFNAQAKWSTLLDLLSLTFWLQSPDAITLRDSEGHIIKTVTAKQALERVLKNENGTEEVLLGLASTPSSPINIYTLAASAGSFTAAKGCKSKDCFTTSDRLALAIIRERELGIPRYNDVRRFLGLDPIKKFSDLTSNVELQEALDRLYGSVDKLEFSVGALSEDRKQELALPPTMTVILFYTLMNIQEADRFWGSKLDFDDVTFYGINRIIYSNMKFNFENADIKRVPPFVFAVWTWDGSSNYPTRVGPEFSLPYYPGKVGVGWYATNLVIVLTFYWLWGYLMEFLGRSFWYKFRKMPLAHQRAVITYVMELAFQTAFFSYLLYLFIKLSWIDSIILVTGPVIQQILTSCTFLVGLYLYELIYRVSLRPQLIAHHIVVFLLIMTVVYVIEDNDRVIAKGLIQPISLLGFTALTEQPIFLALLLYRFDIKNAPLFYVSAFLNLISKMFLHASALYYYSIYLANSDLFWAIFFPMVQLLLLLPAQLYSSYAQFILAKRCALKHRIPASLGVPSKGLGGMGNPPPLMSMPSDL